MLVTMLLRAPYSITVSGLCAIIAMSVIYFIEDEHSRIKIGYTTELVCRFNPIKLAQYNDIGFLKGHETLANALDGGW